MATMAGVLEKTRYEVLALVIGALLCLISVYQVDDITRLKLTSLTHPVYPLLAVGLLSVTASFATRAWSPARRSSVGRYLDIERKPDALTATIGENKLSVEYGRLEEAGLANPNCCLIVLPANEHFDDKCITDQKSALGSFVIRRMGARTKEFQSVLEGALAGFASNDVAIGGEVKRQYPLATAVYLDHPLGESLHLLVVAATTERPGEGLRGDAMTLFPIARKANAQAMDKRLDEVVLPLIGAGHGRIKPTRALLGMLVAWCEVLYTNGGQKVTVRVLLLPPTKEKPAAVSLRDAEELLRVAVSVCEPMQRSRL